MNVRDSYDSAAQAYAEHLATELVHKPLDRHLLNRFAEETRGRGLVAELGCGPGQIARHLARRALLPGGLALISFHIGDEVVHVDDLYGAPVSLDFRFHVPSVVIEALRGAQLAVIEHVERESYEGAEYPSRRCYLLARAV